MKNLSVFASAILFVLFFSFCSEDSSNPTSSADLNLDENLIGKWVFLDSNNDEFSYTFNSDGSCTQTVYNQNYSWKWVIEEGQLKFYIDGGTPAYYTYKIEGNQLYLWVDTVNDWGLPFTKE